MTESLVLEKLRPEDGLVLLRKGRALRSLWVQCPTCGPQPPITRWDSGRESYRAVTHTPYSFVYATRLTCPLCGQDAPYREAVIPGNASARHEKCNKRCLNGKIECHCACEGKCHGEGVCYCKDSASTGKA